MIEIEMAFSGLTTMEVARRIHHTPEAMDSYLRTFDRVLMHRYHRVLFSAMVQVVGQSRSFIEEHLTIADKHFPTAEALTQYLTSRGVDLAEAG